MADSGRDYDAELIASLADHPAFVALHKVVLEEVEDSERALGRRITRGGSRLSDVEQAEARGEFRAVQRLFSRPKQERDALARD